MSKLIDLICDNASIEAIKADLYDNRDNEDYVNVGWVDGRGALIWACVLGYTEAVKLLLEANADIHMVNGYGVTALKYAEQYHRTTIVELLNNHNNHNNYIMVNGKKYKLVEEIENEQTN